MSARRSLRPQRVREPTAWRGAAWPARLQPLARSFMVDETASAIRHDVVNRMSAIANASFAIQHKLAPRGDGLDPEIERHVRTLSSNVAAATKLLDRTFVAPPGASGGIEPVALATGVVAYLAAPAGVDVRVSAAEKLRAKIDAAEAELAIFCLLENAVDAVAAAGGGTVRVGTAPHDKSA